MAGTVYIKTLLCVYEGVGKTLVRVYDFVFYFACLEIHFFFFIASG